MKVYGPYLRKDGRKHVVIVHADGSKTTKSYPRLIMENHLGRELTKDETVDHINNDFTDDRIENLQVLSLEDNVKKSFIPAIYLELTCKCCGKIFKRRKAVHEYETKIRNKDGPYCSHRCVGKIHN
jgi:HNH endonuclease